MFKRTLFGHFRKNSFLRQINPLTLKICERLEKGETSALSKAITIIESTRESDYEQAQYILNFIKEKKSNSIRIGITGSPGAGKSTFIESFGLKLIQNGLKVAVLAVDPSSTKNGGSILGDKTRMQYLSVDDNAFVRPSPSAGFLGGVTANTYEIISLCEHSGYDIVMIETVGVGQSEIEIADLCDILVLLVSPAQGDELQGIKKGIVEVADLIVVNKADGNLKSAALRTRSEYRQAVHLIHQTTEGTWNPKVLTCSALAKDNLEKVWEEIEACQKLNKSNGEFETKRIDQREKWMWKQIHEAMVKRLNSDPEIKKLIDEMLIEVREDKISPRMGANLIIDQYLCRNNE
eukprot:gene9991-2310_t